MLVDESPLIIETNWKDAKRLSQLKSVIRSMLTDHPQAVELLPDYHQNILRDGADLLDMYWTLAGPPR